MGVALMGHYIAVRERIHSNLLGLHVQGGNWLDEASIRQMTAGLYAKSSGLVTATGRAVGLTGARVRLQAYTLSFVAGFHLIAWPCVLALLLIALLRKSPLNYGELGFPDDGPSQRRGQNHDETHCRFLRSVRATLRSAAPLQEAKSPEPIFLRR